MAFVFLEDVTPTIHVQPTATYEAPDEATAHFGSTATGESKQPQKRGLKKRSQTACRVGVKRPVWEIRAT